MNFLKKTEALEFVRERADLFDASVNPFGKSAWVLHFIEQIVEDDWTIIAPEVYANGGSVMLLYSTPTAPRARVALTNYYASLYSPVASIYGGLVGPLVSQGSTTLRPLCDSINFYPLDAEAPDTGELEDELRAHGWYCRRYFAHGNWFQPGMTFDAYLQGRGSKLRNTLARKAKKFSGELRIVTDPTEANFDAFDAIYAKSWKKPEPYPHFVRGWARICAANGWLRLGIATVGGTPIAAQFWFVIDRRAYIFKLAYDENQAKWSAGTLLTAHLMRHVLDQDRVVEVDYLTGDDPYKADWMTRRRERVGLMACNKHTVKGLARAGYEFAAAQMRQRLAT